MDVIVATSNKGKLHEFQKLLGDGFNVLSLADEGLTCDVGETGLTFEENALIKAQCVKAKTAKAVLADDSGLCVNALGGAPGVFSARYSGQNATDLTNRQKLLLEMEKIADRSAKFVSAVVLVTSNGKIYQGRGETAGEILRREEGGGGFGYDPVFFSHELNKSFGNASDSEKNSVSHRAKAVADLVKKLRADGVLI